MNTDIYGLLAYLAKIKENVTDLDESELEEFLWDNYRIDIERFEDLINDLLPLCDVGESPLTGKVYRGFSDGIGWLIKEEVV